MGAEATAEGLAAEGMGQFYLVCAGSVMAGGKTLPERSVIRIEPGEPTLTLQAGAEGAQVLALQFCAPSERPGTDPAKLALRAAQGYVNRREPGA